MAEKKVTVDITTGIGTFSFPHLFTSTATKNDKGESVYDIQFIIPKSQRDDVREILRAIQTVGKARWGEKWKQVRSPLRDGDAEKDELTEDGSTKGDKYPERLGCYFINARSPRPVGVYNRTRDPITDPDEIYGGCKGRIAVSFYPYSMSGNHGIGAGLNGVQKIGDGEPFGASRQPVESMFDLLDEDEDFDLDETEVDEIEEAPAPAKKAAAKKAAKKAPAKPVVVDEDDEDDIDDLDDDI